MATIICRRDGRFEIRESVATVRGPRSTTLAIFSELSSDVLKRAGAKADRAFDAAAIKRRAEELGVPWSGPTSVADVRHVLARVAANEVPPAFLAALKKVTSTVEVSLSPTIEPMLHWIDKDDDERGRAVFELIELGDVIMRSRGGGREGPLRFPILKDL
jgi:hypothetical protein